MIQHRAEPFTVFAKPAIGFERTAGEPIEQFDAQTAGAAEHETEQRSQPPQLPIVHPVASRVEGRSSTPSPSNATNRSAVKSSSSWTPIVRSTACSALRIRRLCSGV